MQRNSQGIAETLLNRLLDRFEAPQARVRDITQPVDYTQVGGPSAQDEFHRVLQDAERAGGIALERERLGRFTGGELARIRLIDADSLYRFLVRVPANSIAETARQSLEASIADILKDKFFEEIEEEAIAAWGGNKSFLGLTPMQVDKLAIVLRLTYGIIHLAGRDIDHRTFSRRTVKDSKALERSEGRVAQLLKRWNPELAGEEPREILEASGVVRRAHLLQIRGPLQVADGTLKIDGTGQAFIGLPWAAIRRATLGRPVDYILTIENATSFWRYCTEIRGSYLALLSDGFPARDVLSSMMHLVDVARGKGENRLYHWGDIDAGGVRIAAYLEDSFGAPIRLHQMSPKLGMEHGSPLQSRKGLDRLAQRAGDIGELARWLLGKEGLALEQEELDPTPPVTER
jgi:hypothetical protein